LLLLIGYHSYPYLNKNFTGAFLTVPATYDFSSKEGYLGLDFNLTLYCLSLGAGKKINLNHTEKQINKFDLFVGVGWSKHFQVQLDLCDLLGRRKHITSRIRSDWQIGKWDMVVFLEQKRNCDELRWLIGIGIGCDFGGVVLPALVKAASKLL